MQNLPSETLTLIFRHFCLHCAHPEGGDAYFRCRSGQPQQPSELSWYSVEYRKPLHALCLASRRLRDIAQPIIFHEFILGYGDSWRSTKFSWDRRLTSFLRSAVERRDLAAEVHRLFLHPYLQYSSEFDDTVAFNSLQALVASVGHKLSGALRPTKEKPPVEYAPDDTLHELLRGYNAEISCSMPGREEAIRDYVSTGSSKKYRLTAALFAILLAQLPDLQHLSFQPNVFHNEAVSREFLRRTRTAALSRLQTLDISTRDWTSFFNFFHEARAIIAPSAACLTTLNLHMCDTFWTEARIPAPPILSAVKHLNLTRCRLTEKQLSKLLHSCSSGLQSFTFEAAHSYERTWWHDREHFQPSDAVTHLGAHKNTLESLHLDLRARGRKKPDGQDNETDGGFIHPMSSLERFTALKHLLVNSSSICGSSNTSRMELAAKGRQPLVALLPPNIITLSIIGHLGPKDSPHLAQGLVDLAESISRAQFIGLRQVRCDMGQGLGKDIAGLFGAHGSDFSHWEWPLSESTVDVLDVPKPLRQLDHPWPEVYEDEDELDL